MEIRSVDRSDPRWPSDIDAAADGLLVAFAVWTVVYQVAWVTQTSVLPLAWPWLLLVVGLPPGAVLTNRRRVMRLVHPVPDQNDGRTEDTGIRPVRWTILVGGAALAAVLLLGRGWWGVWPTALVFVLAIAAQLVPLRRNGTSSLIDGKHPSPVGAGPHGIALGVCLAFAALGSFLLSPDADDVFYVNRATWVAEHGVPTLNDTMFGPGVLPSTYGGGLPTTSVEAAQGAIAHVLGLTAPSLCYLVLVPLLGFLAAWTTWRLIRAWAPSRHLLALVVALIFVVAGGDSIVGRYSVGRIWQGKVTAYCIVLPLTWLLLSRTVRRARRHDLGLLVVAGVAFVGLTTTSALLAPVVLGSALLAALVLRSAPLAVGAVCFAAAPLLNAAVQVLAATGIGGAGIEPSATAVATFDLTIGTRIPMVLVAIAALVLVARTAVGTAGCLLACAAMVTMATFLPGVLQAADLVTHAGPVLWRLAITLPVSVLVGLLVNLRVSTGRDGSLARRPAAVVRVSLCLSLLVIPFVFGLWVWNRPGARMSSVPTWKVDPAALADVRAATRLKAAPGLWLMPPVQMQVLAISSADAFAVVPRDVYLSGLRVPAPAVQDRERLLALVSGRKVPVEAVRTALRRLDVTLACVPAGDQQARTVLRRAAGARLSDVGGMACHVDTDSDR